MILNKKNLNSQTFFDYILIGSGITNIACALHLSKDKSKKILIVEAGGFDYSEQSVSHYAGKSFGNNYLPLSGSRQRMFGGGFNCWGGRLKTFDHWDLNNDYSNWPIDKNDLNPYEKETFEYFVTDKNKHYYKNDIIPESGMPNENFNLHFYQWADKYHYDYLDNNIDKSKNIFLVVNLALTKILTDSKKILGIETTDQDKNKKIIKAKNYIIGTGAIENCRILIYNNIINNYQLFKNHNLLGRYWSDRPESISGEVIFTAPILFKNLDIKNYLNYSLTDDAKRKFNLVNSSIRTVISRTNNDSSIKAKVKDLICEVPKLKKYIESKRGDLLCFSYPKICLELLPNPDNRVTLSDIDKDSFGIPLTKIFFKQSHRDYANHKKMLIEFGKYLVDNDYGRFKINDTVLDYETLKSFHDTYENESKWKIEDIDSFDGTTENYLKENFLYAYHHMGGTRMANNDQEGVVDKNLKVFGQENLYITGSSVFPSFGFTNPTFPNVQLSIRLADYLLKKS